METNLEIITTETGSVQVYVKKQHIKTISKKYADIFELRHILDNETKRLTIEERTILEFDLLKSFHKTGRMCEILSSVKPLTIRKIKTKEGVYSEIVTSDPAITLKIDWKTNNPYIETKNRLF